MHLSQVAPMARQGFLGPLDIAVIEVSGIRPDGALIPSSSIGNNMTWLDRAQKVILEVNTWQNPALEGMHDIYYGVRLPPHRVPIPLVRPDQRIGEPYFRCDPDKVVAVVHSEAPDRNLPFAAPDAVARGIAGHLLEFFRHEVARGRLPAVAAAAAIGRRQHRQRGAGRPARQPVRGHDRLHRGDPGRHARPDGRRQATHGLGHRLLAQPGGGRRAQRGHITGSATRWCCARRRSAITRN